MFRDVLDLVPQSSVKVNDVSVGKVTDVRLDGFTADVTVQLRRGTELPDNAVASIRQTSLLGEKFVSLAAPESGASTEPLASGDVIPLERSGRNPEVEEVLGALSLLLNGGGVAQLRTIARELNIALEGREGTARSVLDQVRLLMTQLDDNKADIVNAIDKLNDLSVSINKQRDTIDAALEELPSALVSIDKQRDDLVKMLEALADLSDVGVRVIQASKAATIDSLQQLNPVLTQIAASGDDFVNAFNVFLTYPFVDEVVGRDPQVARNLHMGDYTNLSITLDLNIDTGITLPTGLPTGLPTLPTNLPTTLPTILDPTVIIGDVLACLQSGDLASPECQKVLASPEKLLQLREECAKQENKDKAVCKQLALLPGLPTADSSLPVPLPSVTTLLPSLPTVPGLPRAPGRRGTPAARLRQARPDDAAADGALRPRPRQPARARNGRGAVITRRTRVQLVVFVLITLVGVSFVGARYARLDRMFVDTSYTVVAHFEDSGGIFAGAEVSYRGVRVGQVEKLELTDAGVDVYLDIDNAYDDIPADAQALVGNRSAVGEQYVELQPQSDDKPYLKDASQIATADTRTPIPTQKLLGDISTTVESVDQQALQTTVGELGDRLRRDRAGPRADHRQRQLVHRRGQRELRHDQGPDPRRQHRAPRPDRLGRRDPDLREAARAVHRHAGGLGQGPAPGDRQRLGDGERAASLPRRQQGRPGRADQRAGDHGRGRRQAPGGCRAAAGGLPVRRRGRLHRRGAVAGHRAVRRPLRDDPHDQPRGLPRGLRVDGPQAAPGRREPADEHGRALRRAAHPVQRPWRAERPATALRWPGTTAPTCTGARVSRVTFRRLARWHQEPWEGIRGSGCSCSP